MLWLSLSPRRLALDALALENPEGLAVCARKGSRRWVVASREAVFPGAEAASVLAARPELRLIEPEPRAETQAMEDLAALAHGLGDPVYLHQETPTPELPAGRAWVCVEIGNSLRFFGGVEALLDEARGRLEGQALDCALGVATTPEAAALVARCEDGRVLRRREELSDWLRDVPLHALPLPPKVRDGLRASGISNAGALLALPLDQLARRFGAQTTTWIERLTGRAPDPKRAHRLSPRFVRHLRFDGDVHRVEGLGFALQRLFRALALDLRARDTGARSVSVRLHHDDHPDTELSIALSAPACDAGYWLLMARERMAALRLVAAVNGVTLHCDDFAVPEAPQLDLFDSSRASADAWRETVERLIARLGVEAVWRLGVAADHRPERAWKRLPAGANDEAGAPMSDGERPMWLFDPPRPLQQLPAIEGAPERIESGWWDGADAARDYYAARGPDGSCLWIFRDRADRGWYLQGLWA
ncbi:Y-family DNA polymerase [Algiphilus aromaticivorans]|uniref:Y-family DNA polymerase n=1 Tax=Algiphilus aromaticivorans TaxID=382454 RepID=UPI0012EB80C8|nr:DNA polymerase Y family protein [Algiphilus aromaticivorans]